MNCSACGAELDSNGTCPFCDDNGFTNFNDFASDWENQSSGSWGKTGRKSRKRVKRIPALAAVVLLIGVIAAVLSLFGGKDDPDSSATNSGGDNGSGVISSLINGGQTNGQAPGQVAQSLDLSAYSSVPENGVQSIHFWEGSVNLRDNPTDMGSYFLYEYSKSHLKQDTVEEYIAMLERNGFTLVEKFYESYYTNSYTSYGLICNKLSGADTIDQQYTDNKVHICIWTSRNDNWFFNVADALEYCDMGLRKDGSDVPMVPSGPSVAAGLNRLSDGSYQTSDGRLTASAGSAMVIRDGTVGTGDVMLELDKGVDILTIDNYFQDEHLILEYAEGSITAGQIFLKDDLQKEMLKFTMTCDEEDVHLNQRYGTVFNTVTVRVMHYEEGREAAVYIYAETQNTSPITLEILCVFSTMPYEEPEQTRPDKADEFYDVLEDDTFTMKTGETILLHSTIKSYHFDSDYHVFDWTITEGDAHADIYGVGDNCYITALSPGTVVITMKYSYDQPGQNVLTGLPQDERHTATKTFTIIIK